MTLTGHYIADAYADKNVRHLKPISGVLPQADQREMGRAYQIMTEYTAWLDPARLAVLRLLSLFERSVDTEWLDQFRRSILIDGLTEPLQEMSRESLRCVYADLRKSELVMEAKRQEQGALDLHPLVRSFFREHLKQERPDTYREAHRYLFEWFAGQSPEMPENFEQMLPLYRAIHHGCEAGLHERVFEEIIWPRMLRGYTAHSLNTLGVGGLD